MQECELLKLYEQYSGLVYRLAVNYLRNFHDAEDAVQAVFIKLIDNKSKPEIGKERAFLISITINYCKDVLRSAWKRKIVPLEEINNEIAFENEIDYDLFNAIMKLPDKLRIVIHLHYYEGYNLSEIASLLKIKSSAVSMRLHRARNILKEKLTEENDSGK